MWGQIKRKAAELADLAIAWWVVVGHRLVRRKGPTVPWTDRNFDEHVQNAYKWLMDYYQ